MKRRFSSILNVRRRRAGGLLIAACLCLTFLVGSVFAADGMPAVIDAVQTISPTTGLPYPEGRGDAYRPVLVEISNSEGARPFLAMSLADIVYEYTWWGPGYTRYLALYNDYHPEMVGSVSQIRNNTISLRNSWDCPIVYNGTDTAPSELGVDRARVAHGTPLGMFYELFNPRPRARSKISSRVDTRYSPYNAAVNLQLLVEEYWPMVAGVLYEPALPTLHFSGMPAQSGVLAAEIIIPYNEQDRLARYTFNETDGHYKRWYNGVPQFDGLTDTRIVADNVIVLYAELAFYDGKVSQPVWNFVGEGRLDVFIDGQYIPGTWQRSGEASAFAYLDEGGSPLLLKPGKTFVQIVPLDMQIEYSD